MKKGITSSDPWAVGWLVRVLVLFAFFTAFSVPMGWLKIIAVASGDEPADAQVRGPIVIPLGTPAPTATVTVFTPTPHIPRIGINEIHIGNLKITIKGGSKS